MRDACTTSDLVHNRLFLGMLALTAVIAAGQVAWPQGNIYLTPLLLACWGVFCSINAFRCGRMHCRITGPICLLGALTLVLMAGGWVRISGATFNLIFVSGIAVAFVLELIAGKYGGRAA